MARRKTTSRSVSASHAAPGPAAGYLFQPERALYWLAKAEDGSCIGIETDDDVAIALRGQVVGREQQKHSISENVPFGDRSRDLWNTLLIWLDAALAGEFDPQSCALFLTTNVTLGDCFVTRLRKCRGNQRAMKACLAELLSQEPPLPESVAYFERRFREHDPKLVMKILARIEVIDGPAAAGPKLRKSISSALHLPGNVSKDDVLNGLLGWVHEVTVNSWRAGRPAWIQRAAFDNVLHRLLRKAAAYQRLGVPERLINVSRAERKRQLKQMYVKQLGHIRANREEVLEAIDDFFRCSTERFRLGAEGDVTDDDWLDFDDQLTKQWRILARREARAVSGRDLVDIGYTTYSHSMQYECKLALDTPQRYLTRGSFHRLANELAIGWHPHFKQLCSK